MADHQWVPWVLSGASLIWNLVNSIVTSRIQSKNKRLDRTVEEFRRVRNDLDSVLADFSEQCDQLRILASGGGNISGLRAQVKAQQDEILPIYFKFGNALKRANGSAFASGEDWEKPLDEAWDRFNEKLNGLYKPSITKVQAHEIVLQASRHLADVIETVRNRLDVEMTKLF